MNVGDKVVWCGGALLNNAKRLRERAQSPIFKGIIIKKSKEDGYYTVLFNNGDQSEHWFASLQLIETSDKILKDILK